MENIRRLMNTKKEDNNIMDINVNIQKKKKLKKQKQ